MLQKHLLFIIFMAIDELCINIKYKYERYALLNIKIHDTLIHQSDQVVEVSMI